MFSWDWSIKQIHDLAYSVGKICHLEDFGQKLLSIWRTSILLCWVGHIEWLVELLAPISCRARQWSIGNYHEAFILEAHASGWICFLFCNYGRIFNSALYYFSMLKQSWALNKLAKYGWQTSENPFGYIINERWRSSQWGLFLLRLLSMPLLSINTIPH